MHEEVAEHDDEDVCRVGLLGGSEQEEEVKQVSLERERRRRARERKEEGEIERLTFANPQNRTMRATNAYNIHLALLISPILFPPITPSDPQANPLVPGPISVVRGVTVTPSTENMGTLASF